MPENASEQGQESAGLQRLPDSEPYSAPAVFDYRLGNRSTLEWVIDQYQVSTDTRSGITNDPNRKDDPYVSLETVKIVESSPASSELTLEPQLTHELSQARFKRIDVCEQLDVGGRLINCVKRDVLLLSHDLQLWQSPDLAARSVGSS